MDLLSQEEKEKIKVELLKKVKTMICPMCRNNKFTMADGYFINAMQSDFNSVAIGGQSIPTIGLCCMNCGFVSQHAIGILGLLPKTETDEPNK